MSTREVETDGLNASAWAAAGRGDDGEEAGSRNRLQQTELRLRSARKTLATNRLSQRCGLSQSQRNAMHERHSGRSLRRYTQRTCSRRWRVEEHATHKSKSMPPKLKSMQRKFASQATSHVTLPPPRGRRCARRGWLRSAVRVARWRRQCAAHQVAAASIRQTTAATPPLAGGAGIGPSRCRQA